MRDAFYTILVVWLVWRIYIAFIRSKPPVQNNSTNFHSKKEGETTVEYIPDDKKRTEFKGGEYVDYEEVE